MATDFSVFITKFSALTGLNPTVVKAWISMEQGVNNNVLGVTSNGHLLTYPDQNTAAIATARLINTSSLYSGIRASTSGSLAQQAMAIAQSPWHLGSAGLAKAGGTDPYYLGGFIRAGLLTQSSSSSSPSGGTSSPLVPTDTGSATLVSDTGLSDFLAKVSALGISTDPTHRYSEDEAKRIIAQYPIQGDIVSSYVNSLTGKTASEWIGSSIGKSADKSIIPNIDLVGALMFVGVILVGITFIATGGLIALKRSTA
jgi:hypothetical protein